MEGNKLADVCAVEFLQDSRLVEGGVALAYIGGVALFYHEGLLLTLVWYGLTLSTGAVKLSQDRVAVEPLASVHL